MNGPFFALFRVEIRVVDVIVPRETLVFQHFFGLVYIIAS